MTCKVCGKPITQEPWNTKCDILVCDNGQCGECRAPVGTVLLLELLTMTDVALRIKDKRKKEGG